MHPAESRLSCMAANIPGPLRSAVSYTLLCVRGLLVPTCAACAWLSPLFAAPLAGLVAVATLMRTHASVSQWTQPSWLPLGRRPPAVDWAPQALPPVVHCCRTCFSASAAESVPPPPSAAAACTYPRVRCANLNTVQHLVAAVCMEPACYLLSSGAVAPPPCSAASGA